MSVVSLEKRLRKVEAARGRAGADAFFLVWTMAGEDQAQAVADLGHAVRSDNLAVGRWPYTDEAPPRPRWVTVREMSDRELDALIAAVLRTLDHEAPEIAAEFRSRRCTLSDDALGNIAFGGLRA